ncbi:MAG TPA: DNA translocase FtsK 4TM domain-containing protein, partial [Caldimonas sp.]
MTFPLGSLRYDGGSDAPAPLAGKPPGWRDQMVLLAGAVAWLLVVIALATHSAGDPGFSTSGNGGPVQNKAGIVGAWVSDVAFFLVGYSVWWAVLVGARAWLGGLARVLRAHSGAPAVAETPAWHLWLGLAVLLAASSSLEWTRLYRWEALVAGGNAGGVLGYSLGKLSQSLLGFAGSGVLWIAVLVAGVSLGLGFSWLGAAERIGRGIESLRSRRASRLELAEDVRLGEEAMRQREEIVEVEHELLEHHLPIVIEPTLVDVPKSTRVVKERQKHL